MLENKDQENSVEAKESLEEVSKEKTTEASTASVAKEQKTSSSSVTSKPKTADEKDKNEEPLLVQKSKLLECGVQYGHQVQWWNPKMKPFINFTKNGIHIINLHKTIAGLQNAFTSINKLTENGKKILLVGTTKQSKESVKLNAERVGAFYIDNRWLGGLLTNFKTIKNSIERLKHLERLSKKNFEGYTKKEGLLLQRELDKLNRNLGGIKTMRRLPDAIFVSSVKADNIAILEAKKLGIPVFGIVDTNVDPNLVEFPIPSNDDAIKGVSLILTIITDAIAKALDKPMLAAYKPNEEVKILGIDENYVRPERRYNNRSNKNYRGGYSNRRYTRPYQNNNDQKSTTATSVNNEAVATKTPATATSAETKPEATKTSVASE